ncbi:MAG: hypothetical protein JWO07_550 [Candidatus Saccharibacteria bacterium]|nr:hypothetical protein [Candidatus Saccharibacteria bacterium]
MRTLNHQNIQLELFSEEFPPVVGRNIEAADTYRGYSQPCSREEYDRRVEVVRSKIESGIADEITISELQDWAELDWIFPQGTFETGQKFGEKTVEEAQEYYDEIVPMQSRALRRKPNRNTQHGKSEAGDYLWTILAMASNAGIDMEEALRAKFTAEGPVTLGDLHELTKAGASWLPLRVDNPSQVRSPQSDVQDLDPYIWLRIHPVELYRYMYKMFDGGKQSPVEATEKQRLEATDWYADALVFLSYYADHWTFSSIPEVASVNFNKITQRVEHGTVNKALGNRSLMKKD